MRRIVHAGNKGLAKVTVQSLIEPLSFVLSSVLADSFVLRIRHLRQAPKPLAPIVRGHLNKRTYTNEI